MSLSFLRTSRATDAVRGVIVMSDIPRSLQTQPCFLKTWGAPLPLR